MLGILTTIVIIGVLLTVIFNFLGLGIFLWPLYLDVAIVVLIVLIVRHNRKKNG